MAVQRSESTTLPLSHEIVAGSLRFVEVLALDPCIAGFFVQLRDGAMLHGIVRVEVMVASGR